jgi:3-dehydroquinate synthase
MARVSVDLPHHQYQVVIEPGALASLGEHVRAAVPHADCALLGDEAVFAHYGAAAQASLEAAGYRVVTRAVSMGEAQKTLATVNGFYDVLLDERLERRSPVIALGGGVAGDMVGFVAATYLRGVPFVQCPTTLLAMVDSSVGGKTGVNVPQGKNLVGAFHQPSVVVADPLVLKSLSDRELRCGLAECIKHAVIRDASLLEFIEVNAAGLLARDADLLTELVRRNVEIKAAVVVLDERESGVRAHLNFGHTFGHALEVTGGYGVLLHGEAVALGMCAAARTAAHMGLCDESLGDRIRAALVAVGLPVRASIADDADLGAAMRLDKKVRDARIRFVLPTKLGEVEIRDDVPGDALAAGWQAIRN